MELWDIVSKSAPHSLVVDGVVCVIDDDPHAFGLGPGQLARSGNKVVRKLSSDVTDSSDYRLTGQSQGACCIPAPLPEC
jgi:hypothetical protein